MKEKKHRMVFIPLRTIFMLFILFSGLYRSNHPVICEMVKYKVTIQYITWNNVLLSFILLVFTNTEWVIIIYGICLKGYT